MTIAQLKYLDYIVSCGSISRAAEQCWLSTSTLARQIGIMEAEVGFPIFEKTSSGVKLTGQGTVFYNETRRILPIYSNALQDAKNQATSRITIRVGITEVLNYITANALASIADRMPNTSFEYVTCPSMGVIEDYLLENRMDVVLISDVENLDDRFYSVPFFNAYNSVVVPDRNPLSHEKTLSLPSLNGETMLISAFDNKHIIPLRRELQRQCPDLQLVLFDDPEVAYVKSIKNRYLISSISLFAPAYGFQNIPLIDAPRIRMGFCCLKGNEKRYSGLISECRTWFSTCSTEGRAEHI